MCSIIYYMQTHLIFRRPTAAHQQQLSHSQSNYKVLMDSCAVWFRDTVQTHTREDTQQKYVSKALTAVLRI